MEIVDFLHFIQPGGPWWLSANGSIGKTISDADELAIWLSANSSANIYYTINHPADDTRVDSRPGKAQIDRVNFLHVDIDPTPDRQATQIYEELLAYEPQPTVVVFSGGGCQALWGIRPVAIESIADIAKVESRNRYIKVALQGDSATDISRIFRLPGTTNYPNGKKRARGQEKTQAAVWHFNPQLFYELFDFPEFSVPDTVQVNWEPNFIELPADFLRSLPTKLQLEATTTYDKGMRSEPLYYVVMSMLELGIHPDAVYSFILDTSLAISDSIYSEDDQKPRSDPQGYAAKQVIHALQKFSTTEVEFLETDDSDEPINVQQFRYINTYYVKIEHFSNKCRVLRIPSSIEEPYAVMSKEEFFNATSHLKYLQINPATGKKKLLQTAKEWFDTETANRYRVAKFAPGIVLDSDIFNFWQGFAYPAKPGNWGKYREFILNILCDGVKEYYEYILDWMANTVQNMHRPGETAIVLYGGRGLGKSFFPNMFGQLFGRHYRATFDPFAKFNAHLVETVLLFGDEVHAFGTTNESKLKLLITQPTIEIEYKGIERASFNNCLHIILATNPDKAVPAALDERRFFALWVDPNNKKKKKYFNDIENELKNGGFSGMLYDLLSRDISDWDAQESMPQTEYLSEQKLRNASPLESWWHHSLAKGGIQMETWELSIPKEQIYSSYTDYCYDNHYETLSREVFHISFKRLVPGVEEKRLTLNKQKIRSYALPTLETCREQWQIKLDWDDRYEDNEQNDA